MWLDQVSNLGPLVLESDALPTALCGLACLYIGISVQSTVSVKIFNRNPLNYKWTHPIDTAGHVH